VLKNFLGRPLEKTQLPDQFVVRQGMEPVSYPGHMRRNGRGHEQRQWLWCAKIVKIARQLKCNQGSEAVTEQHIGFIQEWEDGVLDGLYQRRHRRVWRHSEAAFSSRQLYGTDLDGWRQVVSPSVKDA
jgi:hypothetical protein